jgi:hypothetical protein
MSSRAREHADVRVPSQNDGMDDSQAVGVNYPRRLTRAIVVSALVITLAILILANEVRFQGCESLANQQFFHKVSAQECSRLPWGAKF